MDVPCVAGCGTLIRKPRRGPARFCDSCRKVARAVSSKRYRERQKARDGFERPFLREQHGMTEVDYARMVVAQDGRCAGCDRTPPFRGDKQLHIDHDHRCCPQGGRSCSRCRRGLLCPDCNMALGLLRDDPERLETLAAYLRKYQGVMDRGR